MTSPPGKHGVIVGFLPSSISFFCRFTLGSQQGSCAQTLQFGKELETEKARLGTVGVSWTKKKANAEGV
jgi:hypothetical protein